MLEVQYGRNIRLHGGTGAVCRVAVKVGGRMESLSFGSDGCFCMLSIIGTDRVENYWQIYDVGIAKQSNLIEVPVLKRGCCRMSFTIATLAR